MSIRVAITMAIITAASGIPGSSAPSGLIEINPREGTVWVDLKIPDQSGMISLRLPELISDADRRIVYSESNLKNVEWRKNSDGSATSTWKQDKLASYTITARPEADGLTMDWTITNLEPTVWKSAAGTVCMQSHGLPGIYDPSAERTFLRGNGQWKSVLETWKGPGGNWYLPPGKEPLSIMVPLIQNGSWKLSTFRPDEAVMAVNSSDGKWLVAHAWPKARYQIANIHDHYACTDVCSDLGDIAPGQTIRVIGKIYVLRGGLDKLTAKYKQDLRKRKISLKTEKGN